MAQQFYALYTVFRTLHVLYIKSTGDGGIYRSDTGKPKSTVRQRSTYEYEFPVRTRTGTGTGHQLSVFDIHNQKIIVRSKSCLFLRFYSCSSRSLSSKPTFQNKASTSQQHQNKRRMLTCVVEAKVLKIDNHRLLRQIQEDLQHRSWWLHIPLFGPPLAQVTATGTQQSRRYNGG